MKLNFLKSSVIALSLATTLFSCGSDDNTDIIETPDGGGAPPSATLRITEGGAADDIVLDRANGTAGGTVNGRVIFTTTDGTQRRLYVTQTLPGGAPEPFVIPTDERTQRRLTKPDGSIDLDDANKDAFDFTFTLQVPSSMDNGEIVYNFWSTTGKGDFRDPGKRLLVGVGTIIVSIGNGVNPASAVQSFSNIQLFAPAADGNTETFFSIFNGQANRIDSGPEFRAFWDFGYYYGASGVSAGDNASLSSTSSFDAEFGADVQGLEPSATEEDAANETLNNAFFRLSTSFTSEMFDAVSVAGDLQSIETPTAMNITNLQVGDIIEFEDNFENKGLIRVNQIEPGFNNNDFINIDVKVQPNAPIMDGSNM